MFKLLEIQYFPTVNWFKIEGGITNIQIEQYENFVKTSFRNRCIIPGANGLITMTIPLVGGREQKKQIREVLIDHSQSWAKKHWRIIQSTYSRAPFYEYYGNQVQDLIFKKEKYLFDFNINIINWILMVLNINIDITFTSFFTNDVDNQNFVNFRNKILPNNFQHEEFAGKEYLQVFSDRNGFQQNVSILDLLMCQGPNAITYL